MYDMLNVCVQIVGAVKYGVSDCSVVDPLPGISVVFLWNEYQD